MAANMYKIGDYVYFEISSSSPYQVRRIEELCKTQTGSVEARVMCFYRRRDISQSLASLADKHQYGGEEESETSILSNREDLSELQKHQMKHRELFLSRQVETLPATHIRGKCNVTLLNETELFTSYLSREDAFFYSLVYDPQQKTLLADKGEIRVGSRYQAEPTPLLNSPADDSRCLSNLETLLWNPENNLSDKKIDGFQLISRSVGTFARSLDCSSTVRQPSLHMSAASASRDITILHALDILHQSGYIISEALQLLIPSSGPLLCRDELEEWSPSEANLFDEALDKYGKDFTEIKNDFLPWKTMKSIIEYYYMWKTTDRYVQQKQIKTSEAENKLKQVYIPNYNKPNAAQINIKSDLAINQLCESCFTTQSSQWYAWGPSQMQCRVCSHCWIYWKKYGGLKMPTKLDVGGITNGEKLLPQINNKQFKCTIQGCTKTEFRTKVHLLQHLSSVHGVSVRPGSPSVCPVMKTRAAFCLITTQLTRISRQICKHVLNIHHAARRPFHPINIALIKQECQQRLPELMSKLRILRSKSRVPMERVSARLGIDTNMDKPLLLHHHGDNVAKNHLRKHIEVIGNNFDEKKLNNCVNNVLKNNTPNSNGKKRNYEAINGGPTAKQQNLMNIDSNHKTYINQIQPKIRGSALSKMTTNGFKNSKCHSHLKFRPTPDDIFFVASHFTLKMRKQIRTDELRQIGRHPCLKIITLKKEPIGIHIHE